MTARRFVDTNVLLYAIDAEQAHSRKREIAFSLLNAADLAFSVQVFQEFYAQVTRASRASPLDHAIAASLIEDWCRFPVQEITVPLLRSALKTRERFHVSYWDAAIIEAARLLGCDTVLSDDLADGQDYGGVRVVNPFGLESLQPRRL